MIALELQGFWNLVALFLFAPINPPFYNQAILTLSNK